jgi:predicted transcriptional regulator
MGLLSVKDIIELIAVQFGKIIGKYITPIGGHAVPFLIAGEDLVEGEIVYISRGDAALTVKKNPIDSDYPIGVVYADAKLGELVQIVVGGIAYVLPEAAVTLVKGYIIYSSNATAGRVDQDSATPSVTEHNREIGHLLEAGAGAGLKARAIIHFN